jgi:hypothetical protein
VSPFDAPPPSDRAAPAYLLESAPDPLASLSPATPAESLGSARARTPRGLVAVALAALLLLVALVALDPLGRRVRGHAPARTEASVDAPPASPRAPSALSAS